MSFTKRKRINYISYTDVLFILEESNLRHGWRAKVHHVPVVGETYYIDFGESNKLENKELKHYEILVVEWVLRYAGTSEPKDIKNQVHTLPATSETCLIRIKEIT